MNRKVTIEVSVDGEMTEEDIKTRVESVITELNEVEGIQDSSVVRLHSKTQTQHEEQALEELINSLKAGNNSIEERLQEAREIAERMKSGEDFME